VDAISGVVLLTVGTLATLTALGILGAHLPRHRHVLALALIVFFIALANVLSIAQLTSQAAGSLVAGLIIVGLLVFSGAEEKQRPDEQGRDDWRR
jgi:tetrahydromethanopterin S-methyltransferase subunit E